MDAADFFFVDDARFRDVSLDDDFSYHDDPFTGEVTDDNPADAADDAVESPAGSFSAADPHHEDTSRWVWDAKHRDYTRWIGGRLRLYQEYQRSGGVCRPDEVPPDARPAESGDAEEFYRPQPASTRASPPETPPRPAVLPPDEGALTPRPSVPDLDLVKRFRELRPTPNDASTPRRGGSPEGRAEPVAIAPGPQPRSHPSRDAPKKRYLGPLDSRFTVIDKPKRFFTVGRIFKTVWFEPGEASALASAALDGGANAQYTADSPPFYGERPFAKFQWFVVVRKRLHHSLCLSITTFGRRGAVKNSRGRSRDFVVLYSAAIEPPEPFPEEGIVRDPVAVIIEDGEQFITPTARLDCGRVYTVEDNLKVMKIGRVRPQDLEKLEKYFKESVE